MRSVFAVKTPLLVLASLLLNGFLFAEGKEQTNGSDRKKDVVIGGQMSDTFANESIRSAESDFYQTSTDDYDHYDEEANHNHRFRRYKPINPHDIKRVAAPVVRRKSPPGSNFVPVAAYSITKTKTGKPPRSSVNGYRKRQGGPSE